MWKCWCKRTMNIAVTLFVTASSPSCTKPGALPANERMRPSPVPCCGFQYLQYDDLHCIRVLHYIDEEAVCGPADADRARHADFGCRLPALPVDPQPTSDSTATNIPAIRTSSFCARASPLPATGSTIRPAPVPTPGRASAEPSSAPASDFSCSSTGAPMPS